MTLAVAATVAALALGLAWQGRAAEGRAALLESEAALGRGETLDAILAARSAAEARCPTCDAPEAGYAKLDAIAREAEAKGDDAMAFAAFRAMRAAALATTALGGGDGRRGRAETELARLGRKIDATAALGGGAKAAAASEERLRATLAASGVASGWTFALAAVGAVLFGVGARRVARGAALRGADVAVALGGVAVAAAAVALF